VDIFLSSIAIMGITTMMVLAIYVRARIREKIRGYDIHFGYDEQNWHLKLRKMRWGVFLYTSARIIPGSILYFQPQITYSVLKNGKRKLIRPNFWANYAGLCLCKVRQIDKVVMQLEIVFKDLSMATAFVTQMAGLGFKTIERHHNKIIIIWDLR